MPRGLQNRCGGFRAPRVGSIPTSSVLSNVGGNLKMDGKNELLRKIPQISEVLKDQRLVFLMEKKPRTLVVEAVQESMNQIRKEILGGGRQYLDSQDKILDEIYNRILEKDKKSLRRTINATGTVLHTNLGRSNLSEYACQQVLEAARHYSNLEYDVKNGKRGHRHDHVEGLIRKITGAEAAMVVNNNAAATMLCLSAMGHGKEIIVSRGELVEIGGSFRVPDIMNQSGATLVEVGTTNKTKASDYKQAITIETSALMKVHTSNYRILGFTQETSLEELVAIGKEKNIPVIYDMGCGLMLDLQEVNLDEPTVTKSLKTGIDVILFSGDKLLGGPQGGIIAGKKEFIDRMKNHPLARVLRVDKMTLAAMEATFRTYLDEDKAKTEIPVLRMITIPIEKLIEKATKLTEMILLNFPELNCQIMDVKDQIGGGSAPLVRLKGKAVSIVAKDLSPEKIERGLRKAQVPVICRIAEDKVLLDVRTIEEEEFELVLEALKGIFRG